MKKKKTIRLTHPDLKHIRNNLRRVLISACSTEQSKIHKKKKELRKNDDFYDNEKYRGLSRELDDQYWAIERPLRASILLCPVCFKSNKNMTYNPVRKTWYCTECYEKLRKGNLKRGTPEEFP